MKTMKCFGTCARFLAVTLFAVLVFCCSRDPYAYSPAVPAIAGEVNGIIVPPRNGLKNLTITETAKGRIVFNAPSLTKNQIFMLPRGNYEIRADGMNMAALVLDADCKITVSGNLFKLAVLTEPPKIAFRSGQRWDIGPTITENYAYNLTILDLDNLDVPAGDYSATITGSGINITTDFNLVKENDRIVSEKIHSFKRGNYTVKILVKGQAGVIPDYRFTVIPKPPFIMTVNNQWEGSPLRFAQIQVFKTATPIPVPVLDWRTYSNDFAYNNPALDFSGSINKLGNTGSDGKITLTVEDNDRLVFVVFNENQNAFLVSRTADDSQKTVNLVWPKSTLPDKGAKHGFVVEVAPNSRNRWQGVKPAGDYRVFLYYSEGLRDNSSGISNLSSNKPIEATGVSFPDSGTMECYFDLSNLCSVSNINYFIRVESPSVGTFQMNSPAYEGEGTPVLHYEAGY
jgi:hypothetical protein